MFKLLSKSRCHLNQSFPQQSFTSRLVFLESKTSEKTTHEKFEKRLGETRIRLKNIFENPLTNIGKVFKSPFVGIKHDETRQEKIKKIEKKIKHLERKQEIEKIRKKVSSLTKHMIKKSADFMGEKAIDLSKKIPKKKEIFDSIKKLLSQKSKTPKKTIHEKPERKGKETRIRFKDIFENPFINIGKVFQDPFTIMRYKEVKQEKSKKIEGEDKHSKRKQEIIKIVKKISSLIKNTVKKSADSLGEKAVNLSKYLTELNNRKKTKSSIDLSMKKEKSKMPHDEKQEGNLSKTMEELLEQFYKRGEPKKSEDFGKRGKRKTKLIKEKGEKFKEINLVKLVVKSLKGFNDWAKRISKKPNRVRGLKTTMTTIPSINTKINEMEEMMADSKKLIEKIKKKIKESKK